MGAFRVVPARRMPKWAWVIIIAAACAIVAGWSSEAQTPGYRAMCEAQGASSCAPAKGGSACGPGL